MDQAILIKTATELMGTLQALLTAIVPSNMQTAQATTPQAPSSQTYNPAPTNGMTQAPTAAYPPMQQQPPVPQQTPTQYYQAPVQQAAPTQPPVQQMAPPPPQMPQSAPTAPTTYTQDQLAVAATQLLDAGRVNELTALLQSFGIAALSQLPQEQYGAFANALRGTGVKL